ncbi:MAG: flagellar assembly peptidoglycan hydrolase FlgJ [Gammaproteobacteria bacterium]|nr:flagellar assembly peptidoglycan hydrolase FlgJ [Gammaproteobacteria bacterium]MDH5594563.1 flagellar assembly peptidoglycan hydrolase FlgJ [Gammaproteobacteria bacterium]
MKPVVADADVYTDFNGLAQLRRDVRNDSPEAIKKVAEQFEALFLQMMLKSMRDASFGDELFDSSQSDMYRDMFDQQIAITLSKRRGLGLADMLERQLSKGGDAMNLNPEQGKENTLAMLRRNALADIKPVMPFNPVIQKNTGNIYESEQDFIEGVWPHAQRAGHELGVDPAVLVAQAALETGWGKHSMKNSSGQYSHNLFGIKADNRWQGATVSVMTTEYEDGVVTRQRAKFRAYASPKESFEDYVSFIKNSPRYQEALGQAHDAYGYVRGLQDAGYASDPAYANKIMRILRGDTFGNVMKDLNISESRPINNLKDKAG